ncbi:hypothetical protein EHS25_006621 [Saitozyma podzolica]|uniref:Mitochondrial inner membrane protease subunit 2 n=1 Tax=Saitozyma podzolica TaxID=1890683 RepID=A0A427YS56_9TREE|nr:hypothetical protein EHS25_006621 [Saitozyma podzolica]
MSPARSFFRSRAARDAVRILAWVPVGIFFTRHVYSLATVTGNSMQERRRSDPMVGRRPGTELELDLGLAAMAWLMRTEKVPQNPDLLTTKRIVALEGDLVHPLPPYPPTPVRIPPGHCWVEGDSRYHSRDSNTYGPIPLALITSRVAYILWPWGRTGLVENGMGKAKGRVRRLGGSLVSV